MTYKKAKCMFPSLVFHFTGPSTPRHQPMMSIFITKAKHIHYKSQKIKAIKRKLAYTESQRQSVNNLLYLFFEYIFRKTGSFGTYYIFYNLFYTIMGHISSHKQLHSTHLLLIMQSLSVAYQLDI